MKTIRSTSNMEMLLMFSCSNDNATKCPITANCKERDTNTNQELAHDITFSLSGISN
jgi:hypothetical protein